MHENPSYECMRVAREESRAELLEMRRWDVSRRLKALQLPDSGSHDMLSRIARVIYPTTTGWTHEACEYLRDHLAELIGGERDAQHDCACDAGGCDCRHEQTPFVGYDVLGNERHKAVCELRKLDLHPNSVMNNQEIIADALGVDFKVGELFSDAMRRRLIHLLGGDQIVENAENHNLGDESDAQNDENGDFCESCHTTVTSELRKFIETYLMNNTTITGGKLLAIADRIDEQFARICEQQEKVLQDTIGEMQDEIERQRGVRDELQVKLDESQAKLDEFEKFDPEIAIAAFGDDNAEIRKLLSRTAKLLASAERDRDENYANWMDCKQKVLQSNITVGELTDERDELQGKIADLDDQLERRKDKCLRYKTHIDQMQGGSKRLRKELAELQSEYDHVKRMCYENAKYAVDTDEKACMYLNLLRDAARDYKALQDKLNLVFGMWVSATNGETQ